MHATSLLIQNESLSHKHEDSTSLIFLGHCLSLAPAMMRRYWQSVSGATDSLGDRAQPSEDVYLTILNLMLEPFFPFSSIAQRLLCPNMKFRHKGTKGEAKVPQRHEIKWFESRIHIKFLLATFFLSHPLTLSHNHFSASSTFSLKKLYKQLNKRSFVKEVRIY